MIDSAIQTLFDNSSKTVFLTGAGVSTPSGIPDYRSKNGLYTNDKTDKPAEYYLSSDCLRDEPDVFYQYMKSNMYYPLAQPNVIHRKQAEFTRKKNAFIITQNIDGLYQKANAQNLVEFHGNLADVYCLKCGKHVDYHEYLNDMHHKNCGGTLRPNIVLYGEGLDQTAITTSLNAVSNAELVVVVGTSMRVYPFAGLLSYCSPQTNVIVVNQEQLELGINFTMIKADASQFFEDLSVN